MKKWILLLPCTIFPYSLLIGLVCFLKGLGNVGEVFGFLRYLFLLFFACSIAFLILSISRKWDSEQVSFCNMVVKAAQIPAYGRCCADGTISKRLAIWSGLLQFIFCIDVISAVVLFIKAKSGSRRAGKREFV